MRDLLLDLRDAVRGLRHGRLYAAAVVGTLALTLGATTAIFSIVNGVLLRPLAYPEAERLVSIREVVPRLAAQYRTLPANARHFDQWRQRAETFAAMAAIDWRTAALTGTGEATNIVVLRASGSLFEVLDAPVALGRPLTVEDELPDRPDVVVIGHALWRDRFASDPTIPGRSIVLGGTPHTIVGVLPAGFALPTFDTLTESGSLTANVDAIVPMRLPLDRVGWMGTFNYPVVARLRPGVSVEQARAELDVIQQSIAEIATREVHEPIELRAWVEPLKEAIVGRARAGLLLLLGAIAGVVLIACSNLANLALTRTLARLRESAVRAALGASRTRLVRQTIVEQIVLAAAGGALGLGVAIEALNLFVRTAPVDLPRVADVTIDARVLVLSAISAIASGLAVALLPAWRLGRQDMQDLLRTGGRGATDRGGLAVRSTLVTAQVALSVTLLAITGLFVASFLRLQRVDPGFAAERVVSVEVKPVARRYPDADSRAALYDRILERARGLPAITSISWTSMLPLTGETWVDAIARLDDTRPHSERPSANYRFVGPEYFRTLSIPLLKGRSFSERDRAHAVTPAVISASAADALWPGEEPIGRQFSRANPSQRFEVVGIVADGHPTALDADAPLMVYVPYWFNNEGRSVLVARTAAGEAAAIAALRQAIREVDEEIAIAEAGPLTRIVDAALASRRYQMWLFVAFGAVAILIATIGVYATTAYGVSRRRREMNIRVALGARTSQVFGMILRQSAMPVAVGVAAGGAGALALGTLVGSLLFEVRARDPLVLGSVAALVCLVGIVAAAAAARQGLHLEPAAALRDE